jgi:hypothetical protein
MRAYNRKQIWLKGVPTGKNILPIYLGFDITLTLLFSIFAPRV